MNVILTVSVACTMTQTGTLQRGGDRRARAPAVGFPVRSEEYHFVARSIIAPV